MTMIEMASEYRGGAEQLRRRLRVLRSADRSCPGGEEQFWLRRRIAALTVALTQLNELTELLEHYYERGYYRSEKYRV